MKICILHKCSAYFGKFLYLMVYCVLYRLCSSDLFWSLEVNGINHVGVTYDSVTGIVESIKTRACHVRYLRFLQSCLESFMENLQELTAQMEYESFTIWHCAIWYTAVYWLQTRPFSQILRLFEERQELISDRMLRKQPPPKTRTCLSAGTEADSRGKIV